MIKNHFNSSLIQPNPRHTSIQQLVAPLSSIKQIVSKIILKILAYEPKNYSMSTHNPRPQTQPLTTFINNNFNRYFLTNEEEPSAERICLKISVNNQGRKLFKFQRDLLSFIIDFIETLDSLSPELLVQYKNTILETVQVICQFVTNGTIDYQVTVTFLKKMQGIQSRIKQGKQIFISPKQSLFTKLKHAVLKFIKFLLILLRRITDTLLSIEELSTIASVNKSQQEKIQSISSRNLKKSKNQLADILEQEFIKYKTNPEVCLTCETKVLPDQMKSHLKYCQSQTDIIQYIYQVDAELSAKLLDMKSHMMEVRSMIECQSPKNSKTNFYKKKNNFGSLNTYLKQEVQSDNSSLGEPQGPPKKLEDLDREELQNYLFVVDQLVFFGNKIKSQKSISNLTVSKQLNTIKNIIFPKFKRMNVKAPTVDSFIQLLLTKRKYINKLHKIVCNAKAEGINFSNHLFQNNEYEDIIANDSTTKRKKKHRTNSNLSQKSFSQCQDSSSSLNNNSSLNEVRLSDFVYVRYLGSGQYGEISLVKKKQTGIMYAMKKVAMENEKKVKKENIKNECQVLSVVKSSFIVNALYSFTEGKYHYFIMEYMPNGDFFELIESEERLFEDEARLYLAEIATAINDLHSEGVIHRDIKPHNVLIGKNGHIKLSDFGLSEPSVLRRKKQVSKEKMSSKFILEEISKLKAKPQNHPNKIVGSPYFMSPQVLSGEPAEKMADWWGYGILVFETLIGQPPFLGDNIQQISKKIEQHVIWPKTIQFGKSKSQISYQAKDLIQRLLILNPRQRLGNNFQDIKNHQFFRETNWDKLLQTTPAFEFEQIEYKQTPLKQMSEKTSYTGMTNPDLKLIRKDILSQQTRKFHQSKLEQAEKLKQFAKKLREESM